MGIQAVKGVEVGDGFALARVRGSEAHDEIDPGLVRRTNHAGGLEAGITNGEPVVVRAAMKPLPTLMKPLDSVDLGTGEAAQALVERSATSRPSRRSRSSPRRRSPGSSPAARRTSSAATRSSTSSVRTARTSSASSGRERAEPPPRARRLHGRGQDDARPRGRAPARPAVRRPRSPRSSAQAGATIEELFARDGEAGFRVIEAAVAASVLDGPEPGGDRARRRRRALRADTRDAARERAFTVLLEIDPADRLAAGERECGGRSRSTRTRSTRSTATRLPVYEEVADAHATPRRRRGRARRGRDRRPDRRARPARGARAGQRRRRDRRRRERRRDPRRHGAARARRSRHRTRTRFLPASRRRRSRCSSGSGARCGSGRDGTIVGLGGGCTTDLAGFAAATYMRGVPWVAVPTTLVGQVDAAIGGKTAVDLPGGKNLVGAFHWPARVVIDPGTLETLPERELRNGMAEVVKTGLLMGEPGLGAAARRARAPVRRVQGRRSASPIRTIAARATSSTWVTRSGTRSRRRPATTSRTGRRSRSGWSRRCGSRGTTHALAAVREQLDPKPVRVDREAAWAALARDKKTRRRGAAARAARAARRADVGQRAPGRRRRAALDSLIAD